MRPPNPQEVRRQFADLFIGAAFVLVGFIVALLLYRSVGVAGLLDTDLRSDRHLCVSLIVGVGLAALLTVGWLWRSARRRKGGGHVA